MDGSRHLLISFPLLFAPPTRLVNWRKERERERERRKGRWEKKERYEERTLSGNSIKGVREFSAKPERFWLGCGRILSRNRRPRQNPGSGFYIALRTCIISAPFTYLDRPHHIPPLRLFLLIYIYIYTTYIPPPDPGGVYVYQYYISRNIGWTSRFLPSRSFLFRDEHRFVLTDFFYGVSCLSSMDSWFAWSIFMDSSKVCIVIVKALFIDMV